MSATPDPRPTATTSERHRKAWATRRRAGAQAGNLNAAKSLAYSVVGVRGEVAELVDYYLEIGGALLDVTRDVPALAAAARLAVQARHAHEMIELAEAEGRDPGESLRKRAAYLGQAELRALTALSLTPSTRVDLSIGKLDMHDRLGRAASARLASKYGPGERS